MFSLALILKYLNIVTNVAVYSFLITTTSMYVFTYTGIFFILLFGL